MVQKYWRAFRIFVLATGHIGVLGRAGIFLFAAILFFRTVHGETNTGKSAFGNALAQLESSRGGRAGLFIVGAFTVCYGLFSVLNIYARIFPTPPPVSFPLFCYSQYIKQQPIISLTNSARLTICSFVYGSLPRSRWGGKNCSQRCNFC